MQSTIWIKITAATSVPAVMHRQLSYIQGNAAVTAASRIAAALTAVNMPTSRRCLQQETSVGNTRVKTAIDMPD